MLCDSHIHVGRYYRLMDSETFGRSDYCYAPKVVADCSCKYFGKAIGIKR